MRKSVWLRFPFGLAMFPPDRPRVVALGATLWGLTTMVFVGASICSGGTGGGPNCTRGGLIQQACGAPGTSPCDFTNCLGGGGTCTDSNGDPAPLLGSKNVSIQTWYFCYTFNAAFYSCTVGQAPCGVTFDYEDASCVNICSGGLYWTACAALQGSRGCPGT
jgi:hypothetical protein